MAKPHSKTHDFNDPDPWLALELDKSTLIAPNIKAALMSNNRSRSRQFLLPFVRPIARLSIVLMQVIRTLVPKKFTSPRLLHKIIVWGMSCFVKKEANYLILRHFNIGTQILNFLADNINDVNIQGHPLEPKSIKALEDNVFVQHDLNIFNFIIQVGQQHTDKGVDIVEKELDDEIKNI